MKAVEIELEQHLTQDIALQPASYDIWDKKYRLKTNKGLPVDENPEATFRRVARALADVEETGEKREH